jgi:hypothetical protein
MPLQTAFILTTLQACQQSQLVSFPPFEIPAAPCPTPRNSANHAVSFFPPFSSWRCTELGFGSKEVRIWLSSNVLIRLLPSR